MRSLARSTHPMHAHAHGIVHHNGPSMGPMGSTPRRAWAVTLPLPPPWGATQLAVVRRAPASGAGPDVNMLLLAQVGEGTTYAASMQEPGVGTNADPSTLGL
jgi:hypothetical protein